MPNYTIKCKECSNIENIVISIDEFRIISKDNFKNYFCKNCKSNNFIRIYKEISSKISLSSKEIVEKAKEESRKIVEKIKSGDQHVIRDIYGEGE